MTARMFAKAWDAARGSSQFAHEGPGYPEVEPFDAPTLKRYFADPAFAAQHDAETQSWRDRTNALIDAGMRRAREKREAQR